jgi:hypothetical protein
MSEHVQGGEQSFTPLNLYAQYEQASSGNAEHVDLAQTAQAVITVEEIHARMARRYGKEGADKRFEEQTSKVAVYRDYLANELLLRTFDDELSYTDDSKFLLWGMEQIVERGREGIVLQRDPAAKNDQTDRLTAEHMLARSLGYAHLFIARNPGRQPEILQGWLALFRAQAAGSRSQEIYFNDRLEPALASNDRPNVHLQMSTWECAKKEIAFVQDAINYEKTIQPNSATFITPRQVIQRLALFPPEEVGLDRMQELKADLLYDSLKAGSSKELADLSSAALTNYLVGVTMHAPARLGDHLVGKTARVLQDRKQRDKLHFPVINTIANAITPALSKLIPDALSTIEATDITDYPKAVDRLLFLSQLVTDKVLTDESVPTYAAAADIVQLLALQAAEEKLEEHRSMIGLGDLIVRYGKTDPDLLAEIQERHVGLQTEAQLHAYYRSKAGKLAVDQLFKNNPRRAAA